MNNTHIISISQLRQNATQAIDNVVKKQNPTIIMQRSKPKAVLVDATYYQALEEAVLDLTDAREAEKAKKEVKNPLSSYIEKRWGKNSL
jgi:prevent-host-death family protein